MSACFDRDKLKKMKSDQVNINFFVTGAPLHSHVTISPYNINGILKLLTHVGGIRFYHVAM